MVVILSLTVLIVFIVLLYYKYYKINFNRGGSYIDSHEWIKIKKATINSISKNDNKCFEYVVTIALNNKEIKKDPQRISEIKTSVGKYNWKEKIYLVGKNDWKTFEKSNLTIALNVLGFRKWICILPTFQKTT